MSFALPRLRAALLAVAGCLLVSCRTVHEVKVDAISDRTAPPAASYRLQPRAGSRLDEAELERVVTQVHRALAAHGLFAAPGASTPEVVILVDAGVGPAQRKYVYEATIEPQFRIGRKDRKMIVVHEKYIRLSARQPGPAGRSAVLGAEVWSVHVVVEDESTEFAPYLPVLAAALTDHVGEHAPAEMTIRIREEAAKRAVRGTP